MFEKFNPHFNQVAPFADNMGLTTVQATKGRDCGDGTFELIMGTASADFSTDTLLEVFKKTAELTSADDLAKMQPDLSDAQAALEKIKAKGVTTFTLNDETGIFTQIAKLAL